MKKLFILALIFSSLITGCISDKEPEYIKPCETNGIIYNSDFNKQQYIWENWIFPSNKTTRK